MRETIKKDWLEKATKAFGVKRLKPFQKEVCDDLLDGHDVIGLAKTSHGKSLCFQIQAYCHPDQLMLVITPTTSLMRNQMKNWSESNLTAACLYRDNPDNEETYRLLKAQKLNVLYISPERLDNPRFRNALKGNTIHTVVVDEVHCLIEWGNEFRPMYRQIGKFIDTLKPRPVIAAFSATVAKREVDNIADSLGMRDCRLHIGQLRRENLILKKMWVKTEAERYKEIQKAVRKYINKGKIVIYCTTICDVEDLQEYLLNECDFSSKDIAICHSKLKNRRTEETRFQTGDAKIMVATSAFGMGIDIPDIRLVIVSQMPFSIESYYQMVGRAGRDGKKAHGRLLYNDSDYYRNLDIISSTDERALDAADDMWHLCESSADIQEQVMAYLDGEVKS